MLVSINDKDKLLIDGLIVYYKDKVTSVSSDDDKEMIEQTIRVLTKLGENEKDSIRKIKRRF